MQWHYCSSVGLKQVLRAQSPGRICREHSRCSPEGSASRGTREQMWCSARAQSEGRVDVQSVRHSDMTNPASVEHVAIEGSGQTTSTSRPYRSARGLCTFRLAESRARAVSPRCAHCTSVPPKDARCLSRPGCDPAAGFGGLSSSPAHSSYRVLCRRDNLSQSAIHVLAELPTCSGLNHGQ